MSLQVQETLGDNIVTSATFDLYTIIKIFTIMAICCVFWFIVTKSRKRYIKKTELLKSRGIMNDSSFHFLMTFIPTFESCLHFIILFLGGTAFLSAINVPVSPIFYFVGFLNMGIAFGAKDVVTDIIKGFITLLEGKIKLGDFVQINGTFGCVKSLTIRQAELQLEDGSIELFPFSKIGTIRNYSLEHCVAKALFQLQPSFDLRKFEHFVGETLEEMQSDEYLKDYILDKTPNLPSIKIISTKNEGVELSVSIRIKTGNPKFFASEFSKIMLNKLQGSEMLF
jgi:small-conductance mechanosensitive channel